MAVPPRRSRDAAAEPAARGPLHFHGLCPGERAEEGIKHSCLGLDPSTARSTGECSRFPETFPAPSHPRLGLFPSHGVSQPPMHPSSVEQLLGTPQSLGEPSITPQPSPRLSWGLARATHAPGTSSALLPTAGRAGCTRFSPADGLPAV